MAFELEPQILPGRTMGKRDMVVRNVVEEVNFILLQQKAGSNGVHWGIAPPLVKESAISVQRFEEVDVSLRPEEVKIADLEVRPLNLY